MKTTVKTYLYHVQYDWDDAVHYKLDSSETMAQASPHWAMIRECHFEVDIPDDFDPVPQKVANLKAAKDEVLAKAHVQAQNIEDQIQRLLCLEHKQ